MIVTCPSCKRQLNVPDNAGGKQVRCPICQGVFAVSVSAAPAAVPAAAPPPSAPAPKAPHQQVQANPPPAARASPPSPPPEQVQTKPPAPPPLPENVELEEELPRRRPREQRDELDFDDRDADYERPRERPRYLPTTGTIVWLYVAFGVDVFLAVLLLVGPLVSASAAGGGGPGPGDRGATMAGGFICFSVFMALSPFVLLAAIFLGKLTNRGLVITGGVMAIIIGSLASIFGVILLIAIAGVAGMAAGAGHVRVPAILYIILYATLIFYILVALVNFVAGIKALVTVANPQVKDRFRYGR